MMCIGALHLSAEGSLNGCQCLAEKFVDSCGNPPISVGTDEDTFASAVVLKPHRRMNYWRQCIYLAPPVLPV